MKPHIIILGAGAHGQAIGHEAACLNSVTYADEVSGRAEISFKDVEERYNGHENVFLMNGIGNKPTLGNSDLEARLQVYERFSKKGFKFLSIQFGMPMDDVHHLQGIQIFISSYIGPQVIIGHNAIVNVGAKLCHHNIVGAHSHIAPGAILCGGAKVGRLTHVGAGAILLEGVRVGDNCVVGAGAVVRRSVPDGSTVMGVPARCVKS